MWSLQQRCLGTAVRFELHGAGGMLALGDAPEAPTRQEIDRWEETRGRESPLAGPFGELLVGSALAERTFHIGPGEAAILPIAAGGVLELRAPGEHVRVVMARPGVAWLSHPPRAAVAAAREGCTADVRVQVSQLVGP